MYTSCIYCQRNLGENEAIEHFPVGRRLAFDGARGRLWVICERCRRWNLSPLEERWEAIEECERRFRDTPTSFSTDNIGLAQVPEGLQLVRVGRPERREFAAWRYSKQFLKRRVRNLAIAGIRIGGMAAMAVAGVYVFGLLAEQEDRIVARVRSNDGRRLYVPRKDAKRIELVRRPELDAGWELKLPHRERERNWGVLGAWGKGKRRYVSLDGPVAIRAAGLILPKVNSLGGSGSQVREAVELLDEARDSERLFHRLAADPNDRIYNASNLFGARASRVSRMQATARLALEMAAHEETERRALEGELAELEAAWREAEEIAAIADRLLIPERIEDWIGRQKARLVSSEGKDLGA
ncbi:MAG: hypothetical protein GWN99_20495 [Gemmatimonadetes bacterium]|uniref:Uncharacterized protein n=1 Tax=Candidatus Kutchimonas denitrificans TaxID=3056748 RepID=A0AAE5CDW3_9BACT|nr:hypothetical protein [Gemmatimonadota bacterium]NIR76634.1 hypothetical protein [Candidatus Kutchimonas denitrificans]NIS03403.1 hypothetical protein [Gemmatimonadota bacterium]NIT69264.1 hypothetical protein [Gemmatimonadota bacterium]NIU54736.1 hypothetical protein [Gemmatimonadota bacterium]